MTNAKSTKRALLTSIMALILCFTMLLGTTYAWFTDSVTSTGNKIQAGTLQIDLALYNTETRAFDSIKTSKAPIFDYELWEPGYTDVKLLKVENLGTLALKWKATLVGIDVNSILADVIDVYVLPIDASTNPDDAAAIAALPADRTLAGFTPAGTLAEFVAGVETTTVGNLNPKDTAGDTAYLCIALKMREEANNDYQGLSLGSFDIQILATQLNYESDSIDENYDEMAKYLNQDADGNWLIGTPAELRYFGHTVNAGNTYTGETVKLTADIDMKGYGWTPVDHFGGTFEGNDKTISNLTVTGKKSVAFFNNVRTTAKIQNVTFDKATVKGEHYVAVVLAWEGNETTNALIKNVSVTNSTVTGTVANNDNGDKIGAIAGYAVTLNIEDCTVANTTVTGYRDVGGILGYAHKKAVVKNNTVKDSHIICDASVNYKNYTAADEYDIEAIVGEAVATAVIENNSSTGVNIVVPQDVVSVGTAADLQQMLTQLTSSGAGDNVVNITSDINIGSVQWVSPVIQGYTGADVITINGNGHTITGLNAPLISSGFAGGCGVIIKDLTIKNAEFDASAAYEETGVGAFICAVDSMDMITLSNCHLIDSKITGSRTGGLVGWTSGYNTPNDGPVDTYVTITDCSVVGCEIIGYGTVGAINGHAGANAATFTKIEGCTVTDNTLISYDDSYRVGIVLGTANVGQVTINDITESGNTVKQINGSIEIPRPDGQSPLYGRTVLGTTGSLTIDGVSIS